MIYYNKKLPLFFNCSFSLLIVRCIFACLANSLTIEISDCSFFKHDNLDNISTCSLLLLSKNHETSYIINRYNIIKVIIISIHINNSLFIIINNHIITFGINLIAIMLPKLTIIDQINKYILVY